MKVIWTIDPENRVITVEPVEGYTVEVGQQPKEVRIPFSLERYDSGDFIRYETRDGRVPENVFVRKNRGEIGPVVVTLPYQIYVLSIGGYYIASGKEEFSLDLFMVIKEGDK
jgi:hypothetical protein